MAKCSAITKHGHQCLNSAKYGSYCGIHRTYFKKNVLDKIVATSDIATGSDVSLVGSLDQYELGFIANYMEPLDKLILRATCAYCSAEIQNDIRDAMNMNTFLSFAAISADFTRARELCELACKWARSMHTHSTPINFNWMLWGAAESGHRELCILAREWICASKTKIGLNEMLWSAAEGGHRDLCELAREWIVASGARISINDMISNALRCKDPGRGREVCLLAKKWIDTFDAGVAVDFEWILLRAAEAGRRDMCILIKEWIDAAGGADIDPIAMFYFAASNADPVCARDLCVLVRGWFIVRGDEGIINYNGMLRGAAERGNRDLCILAREWSEHQGFLDSYLSAESKTLDFGEMLRVAVDRGHDNICELARKWLSET